VVYVIDDNGTETEARQMTEIARRAIKRIDGHEARYEAIYQAVHEQMGIMLSYAQVERLRIKAVIASHIGVI
jgi:hypothetical protein